MEIKLTRINKKNKESLDNMMEKVNIATSIPISDYNLEQLSIPDVYSRYNIQ
jgi:hypothetical protein